MSQWGIFAKCRLDGGADIGRRAHASVQPHGPSATSAISRSTLPSAGA